MVALGVLAGLLAAVYALQLTPLYTAKSILLLDARKPNVLDTEALIAGIGKDAAAIASEVELIKSYDVAKRVVDKLKLDQQPDAAGGEAPSLVRRLIGLVLSRESAPVDDLSDNQRDRTIRRLQGSVAVAHRNWTYVIDIAYTSPNPALAAQIVNTFADEYLVDQLESRYDATRRANDWLNERLGELREKVRESERAVEVFKTQHNIVEAAGTTLSDQQIARLNEQLILARAETAQAQAKYDQIQAVVKRGGDITAFADALQSGTLGALKGKASEVRRELANLSARYGDRHPSVVSARAQLADVNGQIGAEARRIIASAENDLRVARSREASIDSSLAEMKGTATTTSQAEITLRELEREAAANKALFESFLSRFKQGTEEQTLQTAESRIIERASTPTVPSAPNKKIIVILGTLLGLGLGAGIAFLLEMLDSGFRTSRQVEDHLGVPVLASVPRADGEVVKGFDGLMGRLNPFGRLLSLFGAGEASERRMRRAERVAMSRLVVHKPLSTFTEAIRSLRMGIRFADVDRPQKVVLVTSALPGEGKSTVSSNLAQLAANTGEKVLLVDLDLRHPVLTSLYAPDAKQGCVELLLGEVELKQILVKDPASGLHFLPSPRRSHLTHSAELLGSQRLKDLLGLLTDYYDLIVVDTSPLLPVTDGRALVGAVDSLVLVVRWEKTNRDAVDSALKQTHGAGDKLSGVVFNDVVAAKARYYDYYKSGYYTKKYPHYYGGTA